jgi:hypothetical protein
MVAQRKPALSSSSALQQQGSLWQTSAQWTSHRSRTREEAPLLALTRAQARQEQAQVLGWAQQGMPSSCAP